MGLATRTTIKGYFETGDRPTAANFVDLIDSSATSTLTYISATGDTDIATAVGNQLVLIKNFKSILTFFFLS